MSLPFPYKIHPCLWQCKKRDFTCWRKFSHSILVLVKLYMDQTFPSGVTWVHSKATSSTIYGMCGKTRRKLPEIRTILLSQGLPVGNLLGDNSLVRLPLLRFGLFVLSRVCLRAYKNNGDEIRRIKCNNLLFGFISHVSVEMLSMLRLIREPQMGQNHWEFYVGLQGCPYQRQQNVFNFVTTRKTWQVLQRDLSSGYL